MTILIPVSCQDFRGARNMARKNLKVAQRLLKKFTHLAVKSTNAYIKNQKDGK